jgi:acetoin utilization deacetylase AcuC-like enzyme
MVYFYPRGHELHVLPGHPETPERVEAIRAELDRTGLWTPFPQLEALEVPDKVLHRIHQSYLVEFLASSAGLGGRVDADTYLTGESWELAQQAAGGALSVAAAVWQRAAVRGFSLSRPPGHHATPGQAMGFCLLNNVALAAEYLLQNEGAKRVAIIDLDVHHGNGTQDIFYDRDEVLFISTHQWPLYPGTGRLSERGTAGAHGFTLNLPLPPLSGDLAYGTAMQEVILPALADFGPDMLLVSAGFDTHWRDPLANVLLSAGAYGGLVRDLAEFADSYCQGRIAMILEGGYDLEGGAASAAAAVAGLLGKEYDDYLGGSPWEESWDWQRVVDQAADR